MCQIVRLGNLVFMEWWRCHLCTICLVAFSFFISGSFNHVFSWQGVFPMPGLSDFSEGKVRDFFANRKRLCPLVVVMVLVLSHVRLFGTPGMGALQAALCMEFSRQEYWSGLPFPSPGAPPDPGIKPRFPTLQADALPSEPLTVYVIHYCLRFIIY